MFGSAFLLIICDKHVFGLCLRVPVLLQMFFTIDLHLGCVSLPLVLEGVVDFAAGSDPQAEVGGVGKLFKLGKFAEHL